MCTHTFKRLLRTAPDRAQLPAPQDSPRSRHAQPQDTHHRRIGRFLWRLLKRGPRRHVNGAAVETLGSPQQQHAQGVACGAARHTSYQPSPEGSALIEAGSAFRAELLPKARVSRDRDTTKRTCAANRDVRQSKKLPRARRLVFAVTESRLTPPRSGQEPIERAAAPRGPSARLERPTPAVLWMPCSGCLPLRERVSALTRACATEKGRVTGAQSDLHPGRRRGSKRLGLTRHDACAPPCPCPSLGTLCAPDRARKGQIPHPCRRARAQRATGARGQPWTGVAGSRESTVTAAGEPRVFKMMPAWMRDPEPLKDRVLWRSEARDAALQGARKVRSAAIGALSGPGQHKALTHPGGLFGLRRRHCTVHKWCPRSQCRTVPQSLLCISSEWSASVTMMSTVLPDAITHEILKGSAGQAGQGRWRHRQGARVLARYALSGVLQCVKVAQVCASCRMQNLATTTGLRAAVWNSSTPMDGRGTSAQANRRSAPKQADTALASIHSVA